MTEKKGISRRSMLTGSAAGVAAAGLGGMATTPARAASLTSPGTGQLNVLIVKSDEHNPFIWSLGGTPFVQTPNLDALAARGTVYDAAYCPSPLCAPSRSSYLSGLPPHTTQVYSNCLAIPRPNFPTYGAVLAEQGIHTAFVGKVDAYRPPEELGFSEMNGSVFRAPGDTDVRRVPLPVRNDAATRAAQVGVKSTEQQAFGADDLATVDYAVEFLTQRAQDLGQPWTLDVNIVPPHFPHYVTQDLWDLYADHADLPPYGIDQPSAQHPYAQDLRYFFDTVKYMTPEVTVQQRRAYYGRITWVDRQVGRILQALDQSGQAGNTVVVYTADHGEMLGKFGMWWKCSTFEDSLRVPLIVAGPGFGAGVRASTPVTQWDLQASIFAALDADRPSNWLGEPLQGIPAHDNGRVIFAEYHGQGTRGSSVMARQGPWKLIWNALAPHQLFHLDSDPQELNDLAAANPGKVGELTRKIELHFCDPELEQDRAEKFIEQQIAVMEAEGIDVP
jgi:choline-sulfatase